MQRVALHALLGLLLVTAGCLGSPTGTESPDTPSPTPTATADTTDATARDGGPTTATTGTGGGTTSPPTGEPVSVAYTVGGGEFPDEVDSVTVTMRVVFTAHDDGRCWRDTFYGPYKPTITPLKVPDDGDCYRTEPVTMDLTDIDGTRSLGRVEAPPSYDGGHALVVTNVTATYENGTTVPGLRGSGGVRGNVVWGRPDDRYRVVFAMESYRDRPYDYWLFPDVRGDGE